MLLARYPDDKTDSYNDKFFTCIQGKEGIMRTKKPKRKTFVCACWIRRDKKNRLVTSIIFNLSRWLSSTRTVPLPRRTYLAV